ncbi:MAG: hypothetical protein WC855_12660 [Thermodesulfovibrionales bacterium]
MDAYEEIKKEDMQRQKDRRQLLLEAVKKEFSGANIFIPPDDPWRIRVEIALPQTTAIVFEPDSPLMTDVGSSFERIFNDAIQHGRRILDNKPQKSIFQGKLHIGNKGVVFEPHEGPE